MTTGVKIAIGCGVALILGIIVVAVGIGGGVLAEGQGGGVHREREPRSRSCTRRPTPRPSTGRRTASSARTGCVKFIDVRKRVFAVYEKHKARRWRRSNKKEKGDFGRPHDRLLGDQRGAHGAGPGPGRRGHERGRVPLHGRAGLQDGVGGRGGEVHRRQERLRGAGEPTPGRGGEGGRAPRDRDRGRGPPARSASTRGRRIAGRAAEEPARAPATWTCRPRTSRCSGSTRPTSRSTRWAAWSGSGCDPGSGPGAARRGTRAPRRRASRPRSSRASTCSPTSRCGGGPTTAATASGTSCCTCAGRAGTSSGADSADRTTCATGRASSPSAGRSRRTS